MKTVLVSGDVQDPSGLFFDLIEAAFEVHSISRDAGGTRIILEDEEDKDPLLLAEKWINRPLEKASRSTMLSRKAIYEKFVAQKEERLSEMRMRLEAEREVAPYSGDGYVSDPSEPEVQVLTLEPRKKADSWTSSLVRKIKNLW